jgi:beta-glucanase (GH16 family)
MILMLQKRILLAILCVSVTVYGESTAGSDEESVAVATRVRKGYRRRTKKTKVTSPSSPYNPPSPSGGIPPSSAPITTSANVQPPPTATASSGACQNILWSDEFSNGVVDSNVWNYDEGRGSNGWGNLELQSYSSSQARVQDGKLIMTVKEESATSDGSRTFSSARINTQDKLEVLYGTIEARIKFPASLANGLWPAFWTLGGNFREVSWPACGEIDILEMGSEQSRIENAVNTRVTSAVHWEDNYQRATLGGAFVSPSPLNDGEFHLFRLEWTSTGITTYVDDNVVLEFNISPDVCTDCSEFRQPHFLILNVAVGGTFPGILDETGITAPLPAAMEVDYVRVCDNGETKVSGSAVEESIDFGFDCGLPNTCLVSALNKYAGDARCGSRIQFLIENGLVEEDACRQIAVTEFPNECGGCSPSQVLDCGVPETCTQSVLEAIAQGFPCGDRISFLIKNKGLSVTDACAQIAVSEFPTKCGGCNPDL